MQAGICRKLNKRFEGPNSSFPSCLERLLTPSSLLSAFYPRSSCTYRVWNNSIRDGNGRTALHFAATGGSAAVVGEIFDMAPSVIDYKVNHPSFFLGTLFLLKIEAKPPPRNSFMQA